MIANKKINTLTISQIIMEVILCYLFFHWEMANNYDDDTGGRITDTETQKEERDKTMIEYEELRADIAT